MMFLQNEIVETRNREYKNLEFINTNTSNMLLTQIPIERRQNNLVVS